jgi:molybdate transport system regulatory protein
MLLERIDKLGSISAAARSMKLTYRNAWLWIESMNRLAPSPLVTKETGGTGGGHALVTAEGRKAITSYHGLRERLEVLVSPDAER